MSIEQLLANFLVSLLATILGVGIILWLEIQRRPRLSMEIGETGELFADDPLGRPMCKWPHVRIRNVNIPRWLSIVYDGQPAYSCRAWITFHHLDGHRVFNREMAVRWSETPEPDVELVDGRDGKVARLRNVQDVVDIPPGEYNNIDLVNKFKGEDECYGWCNQSYLHNWRHPNWKLDKGRYIARIRVRTGGREYTDAFMICNDVPYEDFRVETVDPKTKSLLQ